MDLREQLIEKGYIEGTSFKGRYVRSILANKEYIDGLAALYPQLDSREALYLIALNKPGAPSCPTCGKKPSFKGFSLGYAMYCSSKCNNSGVGVEKKQKALLEKYGVISYSKTAEYQEKLEQASLKRFGTKNANQSAWVKEKKVQTNLKNLGVENPSQSPDVIEKKQKTRWETTYRRLNARLKTLVVPLFTLDDYKGIDEKYLWKCAKCNTEFKDHLKFGKIPTCPTCFLSSMPYSKSEKELATWLTSLGVTVVENSKKIVPPKEIDIYIPSHSLAIELNGTYHHSEVAGHKDSKYHLNKRDACLAKDIDLIQIWDIEWLHKKEIIQSIIKNRLNIDITTIYARKCQVKEVDPKEARDFFEDNHIQGFYASTYYTGLYYEDTLVQCVSFKKARYSKEAGWELTRSAALLDTRVIGGLSRLLKYFQSKEIGSIISYADLRFFNGKGYEAVGFKLIRQSPPSYYYTSKPKCYSSFSSRETFQKHKLKDLLEVFDPSLTEWENMQVNGYDRVWDCGNKVYILE